MEIINFTDYAELGQYLYDSASKNKNIGIVLFKKDIVYLLRQLMEYDEIDLGHIEIKEEFEDSYSKEYYLIIDEDLSVTVKPVYEENTNNIIPCDSDIILFDGDVNSKIAIENDNCIQIEISVTKEDFCGDCCYDCGSCPKYMNSQAISDTLSLMDYIFNHYND